jgi:hypothetical protein
MKYQNRKEITEILYLTHYKDSCVVTMRSRLHLQSSQHRYTCIYVINECAKLQRNRKGRSVKTCMTTRNQSSPATRHGGAWGERSYSSYSFLTSSLDGGEWSASRPGRALLRERAPGTHCTGGWVCLRAGLDTEVTGKILFPCRGSTPDRPVLSQTL